MIIQHFTDEEANRGPHKPTEATPLRISNFNRDGKRTDTYWPPTILPGPRLEFLHTLPYHTQPQGRLFFFCSERPKSHSWKWWSWDLGSSSYRFYYRTPPQTYLLLTGRGVSLLLVHQHATWLHVVTSTDPGLLLLRAFSPVFSFPTQPPNKWVWQRHPRLFSSYSAPTMPSAELWRRPGCWGISAFSATASSELQPHIYFFGLETLAGNIFLFPCLSKVSSIQPQLS